MSAVAETVNGSAPSSAAGSRGASDPGNDGRDPPQATAVPRGTSWAAAAGGVLVWLALLAVWLVPKLFPQEAEILLAATDQRLAVSGTVLYRGKPVEGGKVRLVLDDPMVKRHRATVIVDVDGKTGNFAASELPGYSAKDQQRVTAYFAGTAVSVKAGKPVSEPIGASAVLYTNFAPPAGRMFVTMIVVFCLLAAVLIVLFTDDLSRRKGRVLFGLTYLSTFLSVILPIVGVTAISKNEYLIKMMEGAPVGLVKATTKALDGPQWLLNIGGLVRTKPVLRESAPVDKTVPTGAVVAPTATAEEPLAAPAGAPDEATARPAPLVVPAHVEEERSVEGGLAIPFFVVVLAVFGAGINMMRQVPMIQAKHVRILPPSSVSVMRAVAEAPLAAFTASGPGTPDEKTLQAVHGIRKALIAQYMYLLSAPFLAIAVYYLLQVLAKQVSEPALVLMAFSSGLISDRIVTAIIRFAKKTLGGTEAEDGPDADDAAGARAGTTAVVVP